MGQKARTGEGGVSPVSPVPSFIDDINRKRHGDSQLSRPSAVQFQPPSQQETSHPSSAADAEVKQRRAFTSQMASRFDRRNYYKSPSPTQEEPRGLGGVVLSSSLLLPWVLPHRNAE